MTNKTHPEKILGVPRAALETILGGPPPQGFIAPGQLSLDRLLAAAELRVRDDCEDDPSFKQLIPYTVVLRAVPSIFGSEPFCYRRGGGGGESRLFGLWSLGVGGHIEESDIIVEAGETLARLPLGALFDRYRVAVRRELNEEIVAEYHYDPPATVAATVAGFLNDDSNPVGAVHLGVGAFARLAVDDVRVREGHALHTPGFASHAILRALRPQFESWSQIVIDRFWPSP